LDALTFIAELVKALAWPGCIVALGYLFRENIRQLFSNLRTLKRGDWEITFKDVIAEAKDEAAAAGVPTDEVPRDPRLLELADQHPKFAIIEAWQRVERLIKDLARFFGESSSPAERWDKWIVQREVLSVEQRALLRYLRELRNIAVHSGRELTSEDAYNYIDLAQSLERTLKDKLRGDRA
jgi:hypothetical protein